MPFVDIYSTLGHDFDPLKDGSILAGRFNESQMEAVLRLQHLAGGIGVFQGPPGTGKTHWLIYSLMPLIAHRKPDEARHRILICSHVNKPLNNVAKALVKDREVVVIRLHSKQTEEAIALRDAIRERYKDHEREDRVVDEEAGSLEDLATARLVYDTYKNANTYEHGIRDKRLREEKVVTPNPELSDGSRWAPERPPDGYDKELREAFLKAL